ncbi:MAG: hypothetical protein JO131_05335, partial [Gammaproteobacteria bacterium]|nr:hypothetical protein [Gammaproteobacteria bacterium]
MFQTRSTLPNTILKLSDTQFVVSIFNQAYSMAFKETKRNSKKEFGMDEIAPQLEKLLKPLLMTIELTKESEYLKLSYWAKNHTWKEATILSLEAQNIFYKCVSIQGMVSSLLPILEKQQKQNIIGHIVPISNDAPDFKFIASFHQKTKGVNPGLDITIVKKAEIYQTYTIKQGSTLGGTIAECFTSNVTRNMIGVENTIQMKKVIAPAYLIFRKSKKESKTIEES